MSTQCKSSSPACLIHLFLRNTKYSDFHISLPPIPHFIRIHRIMPFILAPLYLILSILNIIPFSSCFIFHHFRIMPLSGSNLPFSHNATLLILFPSPIAYQLLLILVTVHITPTLYIWPPSPGSRLPSHHAPPPRPPLWVIGGSFLALPWRLPPPGADVAQGTSGGRGALSWWESAANRHLYDWRKRH